MLDYIKNAMVRLMACNYDIFVPIQRPLCDDLVISDGYQLRRLIIRNVVTSKNGPCVNLKLTREKRVVLLEQLNIDGVLASWPLNSDAWIIPIEACLTAQTVRLCNRSDWLVTPLSRTDEPPTIEMTKQVAKEIRTAAKFEATIVSEAEKENEYFDNLIKTGYQGSE